MTGVSIQRVAVKYCESVSGCKVPTYKRIWYNASREIRVKYIRDTAARETIKLERHTRTPLRDDTHCRASKGRVMEVSWRGLSHLARRSVVVPAVLTVRVVVVQARGGAAVGHRASHDSSEALQRGVGHG